MGKLHEILAVEGDLEGRSKVVVDETKKVFGKAALFTGVTRTCDMYDAADKAPPAEFQEMTTTVEKRLTYATGFLSAYFDAVLTKDATNCVAKGDIVLEDGTVLFNDVPVTFLLGLESKLKHVRDTYAAAPTMQQGIKWEPREDLGAGVYAMANPPKKLKTAKKFKFQILYEATDKHPAQIEKWEEQVPVGEYTEDITNGMLTPARKSELLGNIDTLIQAVKKARQRANTTTLEERKIGQKLFEFIHG